MATDCFAGYWWERWARKCVELIIKSYDLVGPTSKTHGGGKNIFGVHITYYLFEKVGCRKMPCIEFLSA
jgi:hypothetical protein